MFEWEWWWLCWIFWSYIILNGLYCSSVKLLWKNLYTVQCTFICILIRYCGEWECYGCWFLIASVYGSGAFSISMLMLLMACVYIYIYIFKIQSQIKLNEWSLTEHHIVDLVFIVSVATDRFSFCICHYVNIEFPSRKCHLEDKNYSSLILKGR